ncbi:MAG TPA: peptidylprolyl isomerase [Gaiellaceae bacterium]|nr:peptidylprolyl isomerase [Gaiellaceae bacterium]
MTSARALFALLVAALALVATACGGSDSVPAGAVAVVNGTEISKSQLDEYMDLSKKGYERTNQAFPKAGTPEYQNLQARNLAYLVELVQLQQAADDLDVKVTEADIDKLENETIKSKFDGDRAEYEKALKKAGYTAEQYRKTAYTYAVLSSKIFDAVTKDVEVTDQDILEFYAANQSQYGTPESRDVRHILIAEKKSDGSVDFAASKKKADEVYADIKGGADFAALAKQLSADPGSAKVGGKLTITRGQTVPEFDKTAFELSTNEVSKPVKTTYGYHIIEPLSDAKKATVQPFDKVKASIKTTLLQQKRNEAIQAWVEDQKKDYEGKVSYAVGYEPAEVPEAPTETQ